MLVPAFVAAGIFLLVSARDVLAAPAKPSPPPPPPPLNEPYHLTADRLEGSAAAGENVYTATHVRVQHGATTVTGDSAVIYREKELVLFRGNVQIVDGNTHMWGRQASYDRKSRLATLTGDVRIEESGAKITGKEARFYRAENRSVITGNPVLEDSTRTLHADEIDYDRNTDVVTALGHVNAYDQAESTRVQAGLVRYDRRADYAWAQQKPVLDLMERGGKTTTIHSDSLEFDNAKKHVYAIGNVTVEREKLRAEGQRAEFYQNENRAVLFGHPSAWDDQGKASGDTLAIQFADHKLQSLRMSPHAVVEYTAKADSGRGERNIATGDSITVHFADEEAREAFIVGRAESRYWPSSADSAKGGRNISNGDTIQVFFDKGKPARAVVHGQSRGVYYLAAEGDTSHASAQENIHYQGREIDYDVQHGLVDVIGSGNVTYKEMNLTADKVTFDSNTDRMRAEGSPVLQDGHDRIVGKTMSYDLNNRKGTIFAGRTVYERGFVYGERVVRVSESVMDVRNGTYSTCDLDDPHYHFGSAKMKIILQDKVIAEPVVFYIKHVPVLALPFYVFPIKSGRHSGFELPQVEFGSSTSGGKFVRNVGYYWAIDDFMDATAWFDYYQSSSWVAHGQYRYHKRYGYQGQIAASYENQFGSTTAKNWNLIGSHYQTLGTNFALTANANLTNSSEFLRDPNLGNNVLLRIQRLLDSNLSLQKGWSGGAYTAGLQQVEDLDAVPGTVKTNQQLPTLTFNWNSRPIGHPARGDEPARLPWLASTNYSFSANGVYQRLVYAPFQIIGRDSVGNPVDTTSFDSTDARGAANYNFTLSDQRMLLGFIRLNPRFNFNGVYYTRDQAGESNQFGGVWNAGLGLNTAIYGTFRTNLGPLRGLRHVITPSASITYQPANESLLYKNTDSTFASRFQGVTGIGLIGGEAKRIDFSLRNDLHAKWGNPTHPTVLNNLIQLQTSGSYNLLAEHGPTKPLSDLFTSLRVKPIQRSDFDFSFIHNPYDRRLLNFTASTGIAFQGQSQFGEEPSSDLPEEPGADAVRQPTPLSAPTSGPSGLPWMLQASVSYGGSRARLPAGGYTTWTSAANLNGAAGTNLSKNWRVDYNWQFNITQGKMISQFFTVKRDLHCWEMQFSRSISGGIDEYYFRINVKNLQEVYFEQGSRGLRGFGGLNNLYGLP